ncbi:hypothetical protein L208DRAFT_1243921 [Tricholoma matsutake]|nr:hypothetical protein L208DRAFT_1243921 [Tricholoma matsutake 945]
MTGKCSICLSPFKEPVSIPCGHVYCTKCLADHVNTPGSEDTTSSCPTCRTVFNIVTPDLTYLPKKYHQYVVPSVRRVFLDPSGEATLQKKLIRAEARVRKLEAEQETLLKQCEKHMSAARAHAEGEMKERQRATRLEHDFDTISSQAVADNRASEIYIKEIEDERNQLKIKYQKLKKHCRDIEEQ